MHGFEAIDVLWITAGLGCDGDTIAMTAATLPPIEDVLAGTIPGLPRVRLFNQDLAYETGDAYMRTFHAAAEGNAPHPFILVVEGSIPNENTSKDGVWAGFGRDPETQQPIPTCTWLDRLAPRAWAVVAAGTCATYGGIHAIAGNPTGCMGLADYLGEGFVSQGGIPIVNVPGCPIQPDNFMETLTYLLRQAAGHAPMIPLDEAHRPRWLFGFTVHEGCDRGGYYEQADFANRYDTPQCQVKIGCWGPVVSCNVPKRGWMNGIGGCPNVGGICIGCTMPGFPDKFTPFMDEPPGARLSTAAIVTYGTMVRALRRFTRNSMDVEPEWRRRGG
jgi:hydrogenase small subunit